MLKNDVFSKAQRSNIMSKIKSSKNASTELKLISIFKENNIIGWRRNYKLKGKPDFVFLKHKISVFTDGCFWHGHKCRNTTPKDHSDYWTPKIKRNQQRDREITKFLTQKGWQVIRIWECELKNKNRKRLIQKLSNIME
ncbi:MAG: very short patch repair endonuclease [Endomicrobium sp.]|jgi:DNA mismatch endonuclease (patch repair protein)|nr:very short patch repair endonuclease [Endomicrobium sp.]